MFAINLNDFAGIDASTLSTTETKKAQSKIFEISKKALPEGVKNYTATVRFLPNFKLGSSAPIESVIHKQFSYYLATPNNKNNQDGEFMYYISPYTFGKTCEVYKIKERFEKSNNPVNKQIGEKLGSARKVDYFAPVLIVSDAVNPENNGKIMIYKFGQKVYNTLKAKCNPTEQQIEQGASPLVFWDLKDGRNFLITGTLTTITTPAGTSLTFVDCQSSSFADSSTPVSYELKTAAKKNIFSDAEMMKKFQADLETAPNLEMFAESTISNDNAKLSRILSAITGEKINIGNAVETVAETEKVVAPKTEKVTKTDDDEYSVDDMENMPF